MATLTIISGGQTGVDRAALDVALQLQLPHTGYCPKCRKAENGVIPARYQLIETSTAHYAERTEQNVLHSDGTLLLILQQPISAGTKLTLAKAQQHHKPHLLVNLNTFDPAIVWQWLTQYHIQRLNIAGPRASSHPDLYLLAYQALLQLMQQQPS